MNSKKCDFGENSLNKSKFPEKHLVFSVLSREKLIFLKKWIYTEKHLVFSVFFREKVDIFEKKVDICGKTPGIQRVFSSKMWIF